MELIRKSLIFRSLCFLGLWGGAVAFAEDERPNIVVIMADDMGYSDLGCYGSEIETPNLDALASEGLRFRHFYNTGRCCPTRASLLTGLYPHQAGMGQMVTKREQNFEPGPYQGFLNDRCVTIAEALKPAGYRTYMSGKWHVGERQEHWPLKRGFERYFGLISGASSYYAIRSDDRQMALEDEPWSPPADGFYMTDAFTDYAVERIDEHGDDETPFFMYVAYTAPHWPLHAPEEVVDKYEGTYLDGWDHLRAERFARMKREGVLPEHVELSPRDNRVAPWSSVEDRAYQDRLMAVYAAMIDRMDTGIGKIVEALERNGKFENTIIFFLADNGGCDESVSGRADLNDTSVRPGERGSYVGYERPWANASNTPFRLYKKNSHEGGVASPLIVHGPGVANHGGFTDAPGHVIDLMPTCLELAGAACPANGEGGAAPALPGDSLVPVLKGESWPEPRTLYWEHIGHHAVRDGDWKLVAERGGGWELYNLAEDRTELHDLSDAEPDRARALRAKYDAWAELAGVRPRD